MCSAKRGRWTALFAKALHAGCQLAKVEKTNGDAAFAATPPNFGFELGRHQPRSFVICQLFGVLASTRGLATAFYTVAIALHPAT